MSKNCAGLLVGMLAFGLSILVVEFFSGFFIVNKLPEKAVLNLEPNSETNKILYPTSPNGKIEVIFKGFVKTDQGLLVETEIINHNTKPAKYWSQSDNFLHFFIKFNDKAKDMRWCGTGMKEFQLLPGESLKSKLSARVFEDYLDKKGNLQIGFGFVCEKNKYRQYWSRKFQIPDNIKTQIKNQIVEQMKTQ
jgi:hypothetical protein